MPTIGPKPFMKIVNNKRGEEVIEMFDNKGKLTSWYNPSRNIRAEIKRSKDNIQYYSHIADENKGIYKAKEVGKYGKGFGRVIERKLDLSKYPILQVSASDKAYNNGTVKIHTDINREVFAPPDVNLQVLVDLFVNR